MSLKIATRNVSMKSFWRSRPKVNIKEPLTNEQKDKLRNVVASVRVDEQKTVTHSVSSINVQNEMDSIRARGFLKYRYNYTPPKNLEELVQKAIEKISPSGPISFDDLNIKNKLLNEIGTNLKHFVPNSKLHAIKSIKNIITFYSEPIKNITKFVEMARNEQLPKNIAISEHPFRFHPNDKSAIHGGITAFPGDGGEVLSLRNKRLLRQFKPKKEWFEYEDRSFDYEPIDKGMPWDPEVAKKMDRYASKRFLVKSLK